MTAPPPDDAYVVALASLAQMGPARLGALLGAEAPAEAWATVAAGQAHRRPALSSRLGKDPAALSASWRAEAAGVDVGALWSRHAGIGVHRHGGPGYPTSLLDDPDPPAIVFSRGDLGVLDRPAVAVVGTRSCTRAGLDAAADLGRGLAAAGVAVVSGLALGIDGAAHRGALEALDASPGAAPPVGVVASGIDVVYPLRHRRLWEQVATRGLLLTEAPLGLSPDRWRFPARNRVVAGLCRAVVVVESSRKGGSMYTVEEAMGRGRDVFAYPGPVASPASEGTNQLLFDGALMARDAADVLGALGLDHGPRSPSGLGDADYPSGPGAPGPDPARAAVLDALGWQPASLEQLTLRAGLDLAATALAVERLVADGRVARHGLWLEQVPQ